VAEDLEAAAVGVAAERHAVGVVLAGAAARAAAPFLALAADLAAGRVDDRLALAVLHLRSVGAVVAGVEVKAAVGAEHDRVQAVVVVDAREAVEEDFGRAFRLVAGGVDREDPHLGGLGDVDLVAEDADAQRADDRFVLVEGLVAVALAVAVRVFHDQDAVAFGPHLRAAVIHRLNNPDAAALVDVHVGGIDEPGLAGPERHFRSLVDFHRLERVLDGRHAGLLLFLRGSCEAEHEQGGEAQRSHSRSSLMLDAVRTMPVYSSSGLVSCT
jgi:hypothetical protein